ncbi:uncharacterized protein LOC116115089 [Pistacia vera]|uniref:uncharacterized protein LOC116115089 n=1 Tax=Pistacia vera TaxID=55513 RepID=UPI00126331E9|nr:uncharacterized protein LOC116115089 [Pistacia vera]
MLAFKKAQQMKDSKDDAWVANNECEFLVICQDETQTLKGEKGWVLDFAASMHVCNDKDCFVELKEDENYGNIIVSNNDKVKIEDIGSVRFKLYNGVVKKLCHVRYVSSCSHNLISLGELASHGYTYIGQRDGCEVYKDDVLILQGKKNEKQLHLLDEGECLKKSRYKIVPVLVVKEKKTIK